MNLRYRNFHPRDTADCLRLLESYPEYTPQLLADLPLFWKRLFEEQAMISAVIENHEPGNRASIVAFGADVFVTDTFMNEARSGTEPYLTKRVVRAELSGKASPILRRDAIARANAGEGLNIINVNVATLRAPADQLSDYRIRYNVRDAFIWSHRGYHIKEFLQEVWDESDREWVKSYGVLPGQTTLIFTKGMPALSPNTGLSWLALPERNRSKTRVRLQRPSSWIAGRAFNFLKERRNS